MSENIKNSFGELISFALDHLNKERDGDTKFDELCSKIIKNKIDPTYFSSSGLDAGGDGGIDGWGFSTDGKIKYAFSIEKTVGRKIESEISKWKKSEYNELRYFTNQSVSQRLKTKYTSSENKVTIFDQENLRTIIEMNPEIGVILGLPKLKWQFEKNSLRYKHQFLEKEIEIKCFCTRNIHLRNEGKDNIPRDPIELLLEKKWLVIEAPAGFGKTSLLQQIYLNILYSEELPVPIYIKLKDYLPGTFINQIQTAIPLLPDVQLSNFVLLLDGYDEVPEIDRPNLIKEINHIFAASGEFQLVIITARSDQYTNSDIKELDKKFEFAFLEGLTKKNIGKLLDTNHISDYSIFMSNELFLSTCQNPFYVKSLINYFFKMGSIASNIVQLMDYISSLEMDLFFKGKKIQETYIQNIALYMMLNQTNDIPVETDESSIRSGDLSPIRDMHRSILEYLAAKRLSQFGTKQIITWISSLGRIHSSLSNTFGFMLNILCTSTRDYQKFHELIEWSLNENVHMLIQIESDKISPEMNHRIFKKYFESRSILVDFRDIQFFPISFILRNYQNIKLITDFISKNYNSTNYEMELEFCIILLQKIILTQWINCETYVFQTDENETLLTVFLDLLEKHTESRITSSMFYIACYNPHFTNLSKEIIASIVDRVNKINDKEGVISNLCKLFINIKIPLSIYDYKKILTMAFKHMDNFAIAFNPVPSKFDDDYETHVVNFISIQEFYELSKIFMKANPETYWQVFGAFNCLVENRGRHEKDCDEFYTLLFEIWKTENQVNLPLIDNNEIQKFITIQFKNHSLDRWLEAVRLVFLLKGESFLNVLSPVFSSEMAWLGWRYISYEIWKDITSITDFLKICEIIEKDTNPQVSSFYKDFRVMIPKNHVLFPKISEFLREEEVKYIFDQDCKDQAEIEKSEKLEAKPREDISVLFSEDTLLSEFRNFFSILGKNRIERKDLQKFCYFRDNLEINRFISDYCLWMLRDDTSEIDCDSVHAITHTVMGKEWGIYFAQYVTQNSINLELLSEDQRGYVRRWIELIINEFPMRHHIDVKHEVQFVCCQLLRSIQMPVSLSEDILLGAVFSGYPTTLGTGVIFQHYESYSIDYLEKYIPKDSIIDYLIKNFTPETISDVQAMVACEYLFKNSTSIFPYRIEEIKEKLIKFINFNMDSLYQTSVIKMVDLLNISIKDLSEPKIIDALKFENEMFKYNYASHLLSNNELIKNESDNAFRVQLLFKVFTKVERPLKVRIAELLISCDPLASDVFKFFALCLLEKDSNERPSSFPFGIGLSQFYTANFDCIDVVEKLLIYSLQKKSYRRDAIRDISIESYMHISEKINSVEDFEKVIESLTRVMQITRKKYLSKYIEKIKTLYSEKNYRTNIAWKEIIVAN